MKLSADTQTGIKRPFNYTNVVGGGGELFPVIGACARLLAHILPFGTVKSSLVHYKETCGIYHRNIIRMAGCGFCPPLQVAIIFVEV
ncbi:MAG: hypothetical protein JXR91_05550, partial [Deltaproteobacteria bacterium]|nr:hypothetical protein [Deltaproteobacteria bacterium]